MQQNVRVTAFTVFELLKETNRGWYNYPLPLPPTLGLKYLWKHFVSLRHEINRCLRDFRKTLVQFSESY